MRTFLILTLPKSMSGWLSCFLTTGRVNCLHDLMKDVGSAEEYGRTVRSQDCQISGVSDPSAICDVDNIIDELEPDALVTILRDPNIVTDKTAGMVGCEHSDLVPLIRGMNAKLRGLEDRHLEMHFDALLTMDGLRVLWDHVTGGEEFPYRHAVKMLTLHIRQTDGETTRLKEMYNELLLARK